MKEARNIALNIGKGIYTITTPLENEELDRVKALINEACGEISKGAKQEDLLMLACLRLAHNLDTVNGKLYKLLAELDSSQIGVENRW